MAPTKSGLTTRASSERHWASRSHLHEQVTHFHSSTMHKRRQTNCSWNV